MVTVCLNVCGKAWLKLQKFLIHAILYTSYIYKEKPCTAHVIKHMFWIYICSQTVYKSGHANEQIYFKASSYVCKRTTEMHAEARPWRLLSLYCFYIYTSE